MKKEKKILFLLVVLTTIIGTFHPSKATGQLDVFLERFFNNHGITYY